MPWTEFLYDGEEEEIERGEGSKSLCTPERLLDYLLRHKQVSKVAPTLAQLKAEFKGVLNVLMSAWELKRQGKYPQFETPPRKRRFGR